LAYYWDHKDELDQDIAVRLEKVANIRQSVGASTLRDKLRTKGLL
jgi:hypothetical protein